MDSTTCIRLEYPLPGIHLKYPLLSAWNSTRYPPVISPPQTPIIVPKIFDTFRIRMLVPLKTTPQLSKPPLEKNDYS